MDNGKQRHRSPLRHAHIVGWGMAVPERVLTNDDLAGFVDTSDEWIRTRTGIRERRIAGTHETTATLGLRAAQAALDVADLQPIEIDLIVVATSTPDYVFPSTASLIQDWIGASRAGAFDLSAACTGFVYALTMAVQSIRAGSVETALVIGAETMSRVLDWSDRNTCVLFGDGAGAVILRACDQPGGVLACTLGSDGSGADMLTIPNGAGPESIATNGAAVHKLHMEGRGVFRFSTRIVGTVVTQTLEKAGVALEDVALIVPHQANQRIIDTAARHLKFPADRFFSNLASYGNTSSASIPIALCEAVEQGRIKPEDKLVLVGFGGGLTWGAAVIQWPKELPPEASKISQGRRRATYILWRWRKRAVRRWWRIQTAFMGKEVPLMEDDDDSEPLWRLPPLWRWPSWRRKQAPEELPALPEPSDSEDDE
jgi:3-oxoacyl-[acyl-carrier-protein] synthase-3